MLVLLLLLQLFEVREIKHSYLFCLIFQMIVIKSFGQQFVDKTFELGIYHSYGLGQAGGGVSCADFDNDGWDDITLGSSQNKPIHFYKNINGKVFQRLDLIGDMTDDVKSIMWIDFDNDGDKDLYFTTGSSRNRLYENLGNLNLKEITLEAGFPDEKLTSFGACWGDYNRDGLLDVYYGERRLQFIGQPNRCFLFKNLGNKKFEDVTTSTRTIDDKGKTHFCSSFIDFDNDKWPDLYTAQDRYRGNTLLRNQGIDVFEDVSVKMNAGTFMDGMSVSYGDVNSDGFLDIYISNTDDGNVLLINKDGKRFENEAEKYGVSFNGIAWGTNFLDGDNDGDQDLYVSSMLVGKNNITSTYYKNEGFQKSFVKGPQVASDTVSSFSNGIGDFNNDGYPDIISSNSEFQSMVFYNKGNNGNNFIKLKLEGKKSNKAGVGTHILVETPDGNKQRFLSSCGVGYLAQNSDVYTIGIKNNTTAVIKLIWPTGHVDIINDIKVNSLNKIVEGQSNNGNINIDIELQGSTEVNEESLIDNELFPNPTNGKLHFNNWENIDHISIYNISGIEISQVNMKDFNGVIDIKESGSYIVKAKLKNKIIKQYKIQVLK
jgi:hypothetical protein